ncbi:MAG: phosphatase PAP2 family protein [Candidatus Bipolaricaulis sp.]|nr:phosphatase PAP2 family protein [Candidatus Bipolaricaulis sp.]
MNAWSRFVDRIELLGDAAHAWDARAMEAISGVRLFQRVPRFFRAATYLGDGYLWGGLALGLLLFGETPDRWNVLVAFCITVVNMAVLRLLKTLCARERPAVMDDGLRARVIDTYSFPSGHATTSFGIAWVVSSCYSYPVVQALVYMAAATIALSRVCVREHFLLDVVAGAALGTSVAAGFLPLLRWLLL